VEIVALSRIYPLESIIGSTCDQDVGFNPRSLFQMVMRFPRIDPVDRNKIKARHLDPVALKQAWRATSAQAREEMTTLADEQPDTPTGLAFVDAQGEPAWIRCESSLRVHPPSLRGCLRVVK
jgi:hypothetical protein